MYNKDATDVSSVLKPISEANGLSNDFYADNDFFKKEREQVFAKNWAAVMFASQLPAENWVKPIDFMGVPILFLNDEGTIRVFHNICRHRGHKLVNEEKEIAGVISCPYHCWTYKNTGELIATPHIGGVEVHQTEGFERSKYGLLTIKMHIFMNVVFVNIDNQAPPFDEYLKPLTDRWSEFVPESAYQSMFKGVSHSEWNYTTQCNWKLAVENYCEAYHLPFVHPELNSYSPLNVHYNITIEDKFSGQGTRNYAPANPILDGVEIALPHLKQWPKDKQKYGEYISLYPNVLLGIQIDHAFAMILTPVAANKTVEQLEVFYFNEGATEERYAPCREAVVKAWEVVFLQDVDPIEAMQNGRESQAFDGGVFSSELDVATHHFHCWIANHYNQPTNA